MRKAVRKRIKVTKTGKLLHRRAGHNHFNAKAPRRTQLRHNKMTAPVGSFGKKIRAYLNQNQ
jgi:ribosomal protein L35